jgi:hypothetical protein
MTQPSVLGGYFQALEVLLCVDEGLDLLCIKSRIERLEVMRRVVLSSYVEGLAHCLEVGHCLLEQAGSPMPGRVD